MDNARLLVFESYCRIHQRIDLRMLAAKLNLDADAAEKWVVNLIRNADLNAKINSQVCGPSAQSRPARRWHKSHAFGACKQGHWCCRAISAGWWHVGGLQSISMHCAGKVAGQPSVSSETETGPAGRHRCHGQQLHDHVRSDSGQGKGAVGSHVHAGERSYRHCKVALTPLSLHTRMLIAT